MTDGQPKPAKFAFFAHPLPYGLFTVFRHLRAGLAGHGVELHWLGMGRATEDAIASPLWPEEMPYGRALPSKTGDTPAQIGRRLHDFLVENNYTGVFVNPPQQREFMNIVRYLPQSMVRVMIVHSVIATAYKCAAALRPYVHATVAISPRVHRDLLRQGFDPARTQFIPNGIDLAPYRTLTRRPPDNTLRILYLGRLDQNPKGVLWLPEIVNAAKSEHIQLSIAGEGPGKKHLLRASEQLGRKIDLLGVVADVPGLLARYDVLILPSQSEGLGMVLIEAMCAGCVPIASRIRDATDFVIKDGETGFLFRVGAVRQAAAKIDLLSRDRARLAQMSQAARADALGRFDAQTMADSYAQLLQRIGTSAPQVSPSLSLDQWTYPRAFRGGWRRYIPLPVRRMMVSWIGPT